MIGKILRGGDKMEADELDKKNGIFRKPEEFRRNFRQLCADNVFSGGYTIERTKGWSGEPSDNSIPYDEYLAQRLYDETCRDVSGESYNGDNVR